MKYRSAFILAVFIFCTFTSVYAQDYSEGEGTFDPNPEHVACLSPADYQKIESMLDANRKILIAKGILKTFTPLSTPAFGWPLREAAGRNYNYLYDIGNFIDHDARYPNHVLDYMGGTRTYDTQWGYNHQGTDIGLWPFSWNMMDSLDAQIVAAADGVILAKTDGHFDRECGLSQDSSWNAVYLQHADGTVTWYGHMKKGSQTSKPVGASVVQGEFLGNVGSAGSSTGPHLHFEIHDANKNVIDPWFGPDNPSVTTSWWADQKPYVDPEINVIYTHSSMPVFTPCPDETIENRKDIFNPGDSIYFIAYYHDENDTFAVNIRISEPDGSLFKSWTHKTDTPYYKRSYSWRSYMLPTNASAGTWTFIATAAGKSASHNFVVASGNGIAEENMPSPSLSPNPTSSLLTIRNAPENLTGFSLVNVLGQFVLETRAPHPHSAEFTIDLSPLPAGMYYVRIQSGSSVEVRKIIKQ